jgi:hypothetical protein
MREMIILITKKFKMSPADADADADNVPFYEALSDAGYPHVYWKDKTHSCVNLEAVERMNLCFLQKKLLDKVAILGRPKEMTDETANQISELLHQYCKLIPTV